MSFLNVVYGKETVILNLYPFILTRKKVKDNPTFYRYYGYICEKRLWDFGEFRALNNSFYNIAINEFNKVIKDDNHKFKCYYLLSLF